MMAELGLSVDAAKCSEQPGTHKALFKDLPPLLFPSLDFLVEGELPKSRVLFCLILGCGPRPSDLQTFTGLGIQQVLNKCRMKLG